MYQHILAATDGSPFALEAVRHALALAKSTGARTTVITVTPTWRSLALSEIAVGRLEEHFAARMAQLAAASLAPVQQSAADLGLACEAVHVTGDNPYECILAAAAERDCDLIVVGSHGRRGIERLLLGSEATKLLTHSKLPVLVYRR